MINKLTGRHSCDEVQDYHRYVIKCSCCGTILNFGKDDVYKAEDDCLIHHEYIDCPECREKLQLDDNFYYGY